MSEILNWLSVNPVRWVVPAVLLVAVLGIPVALWWERRRSSTSEYVARMWSRRAPAPAHRGHDEAALDAAELAETGRVRPPRERLRAVPDVLVDAEEAARWTASRMAEAAQRNALFHP